VMWRSLSGVSYAAEIAAADAAVAAAGCAATAHLWGLGFRV